ncbi:NAD(P)/FAD-dependent oxidoreductase [Streptomyces sp. MNP-20]|uniref:NAD(P)/FAD-dependent oxidoreductase n=1 Tax=Streptomyces sp. MNP-20 TaxID=2721165 RepID=UPI001552D274|nr:FAD-dependent oxidoreductase [Streptomyces sp. MNP-20]
MRTVIVVGASLAGLYAVRELRAQGFDGRLVVIGAEPHAPYDRPPLSKTFLTGPTPGTRIATGLGPGPAVEPGLALADAEELAELDAEWLLGVPASGLDTGSRTVLLADGRAVVGDGVVIATGARARPLPGPPLTGVHTLRTLDDARALRTALTCGPRRVVVIGGGFIGAETASSCVTLGHDVTVVEAAPLPLVPQLGADMAAFCADLHRRGGARLLTGTGVAGLRPALRTASGSGPGARVAAVELADGRLLPADVVVVGIGAQPNTAWLEGTSLDGGAGELRGGVPCDEGCVTVLPQVVAVGDVARVGGVGAAAAAAGAGAGAGGAARVGGVRAEHWTNATEQPRVAVRNLLAARTVETVTSLPYFWSDQYGSRIQFAGHRSASATVRVREGGAAPGDGGFLAVYEDEGRPTAVLAVDRPRAFMRARRGLRAGHAAAV